MARQHDPDAVNLSGGTVRLYRDEVLGIGSYGKVCRAERDHLPCAAKIIHETLFDPGTASRSPNHAQQRTVGRTPLERFRQECEILRRLNHSNVIQYLGTYQHPDTGLPVLLMELMEASLTHYLEEQQGVLLSFHVQVNICNDIVLALAFLHANGIIHRDLSSNNVLLNGLPSNIRAKVTDFGMARLVGMECGRSPTLTTCPGATVYMPPEAVQDVNPVYTNKIDCFSFGVLIIQILTLQFPNPSDRHGPLQVHNTGLRNIRSQEIVPEIDRRHSHINQIDPRHPLLPTALRCLQDDDIGRPTAQQLCEQMAVLRQSPEYADSARNPLRGGVDVPDQVHPRQRRREQLQCTVQLHGARPYIHSALDEDRQPAVTVAAIDTPPVNMRLNWTRGRSALCDMYRWCDAVVGEGTIYFRKAGLNNFHINYRYNAANRRWTQLPRCPLGHPTLVIIDGQLTAIGDKAPLSNELSTLQEERGHHQQWIALYPSMPTRRYLTTALCTEVALIVAGGVGDGNSILITVEIMHRENRQWFTAASLPLPLTRCSVTLLNGSIYILGGLTVRESTQRVLSCSLRYLMDSATCRTRASVWNILADLPVYDSTCVAFYGSLLAIGGRDEDYNPTSAVHVYKPATNTWEVVSHMATQRYQCFAAVLGNEQIMLVGGAIQKHPRFQCTRVVEFATLRTSH